MSTQGAKLLTLILAGACGVLFLLALALQIGLGRGYSWLPAEVDASAVGAAAIDRTPFKLAAETEFAATQARPLFNEDRKPTPDEPSDESGAPQPPSAPLNVALTGVVLTPELRVAMVQDKSKGNASVALKEGMPMPGDQGGWTLARVNPRSAIFRETSGDEIEVELTTAVANPRANAPGRPNTPAVPGQARVTPNAPVAASNPNPQSEALQRRIEERRKQMRDEAERMKQQPQPAPPPPPTQPEL
jgi:general secretion pathway protein N